jgi:hypothetical protein
MKRKIALISLVATSGLLLTGCATGNNAPTSQIKQVTDGVEADSGAIKVRDFLLVNQADGSAVIVGTIVNDGSTPDQVTGITVNNSTQNIVAKIAPASLNLNTNQPVIFAGPSANAAATLPNFNGEEGTRYSATITFQNAAPVTLSALLEAKSGYFANVGESSTVATASTAAKK